ncbi:MAG: ornithine carbamoyltransferase [Gammaproteobacteria bacterium]|nr:MAG: ornithine carbamoyltransferase [Gammaproteobacteria bacterium]
MSTRHFLSLMDMSQDELNYLIKRACELKEITKKGEVYEPLKNKVLGMIFEKSSTRTRVSFEAGMIQLGGGSIFLSPRDTQLGRGEPIEDTARVLSSMLDCVMIRTFAHDVVTTMAKYSNIPIINGLTDLCHPCQLLADMQTYYEHRGNINGKTVAWIGDGNNMANSYILAANQFGFKLNLCTPKGYEPDAKIMDDYKDCYEIIGSPEEAASSADLIVTDVWASMGQEEEQAQREKAFANFQVDDKIMGLADKDAVFMHCLPAHRGEEVSATIIDGPQSIVWDEAENRLHAQKALMEYLLCGKRK